MKRADKTPFVGRWRIQEMEVWDQDYVDIEVPGYIEIKSDGLGRFQFGLVAGELDGRFESCGEIQRFDFSWQGVVENDPVSGRSWVVVSDEALEGRIYFHLGDDSAFRAVRSA